eukprot:8185117-Karenia_brevis.AAC.1
MPNHPLSSPRAPLPVSCSNHGMRHNDVQAHFDNLNANFLYPIIVLSLDVNIDSRWGDLTNADTVDH